MLKRCCIGPVFCRFKANMVNTPLKGRCNKAFFNKGCLLEMYNCGKEKEKKNQSCESYYRILCFCFWKRYLTSILEKPPRTDADCHRSLTKQHCVASTSHVFGKAKRVVVLAAVVRNNNWITKTGGRHGGNPAGNLMIRG